MVQKMMQQFHESREEVLCLPTRCGRPSGVMCELIWEDNPVALSLSSL